MREVLIMSAEYVWGAIFIMMGVTYISRIIPFLLLAGKPVPVSYTHLRAHET